MVESLPQIAVLFALPTDRAMFDEVARGEVLQDYRSLLLRGSSAEATWLHRYTRVAAAAQELIAVAGDLGASIWTRATLGMVREASAASDVVIVVGHWKGWTVAESDLCADGEDVIGRLADAGLGDMIDVDGRGDSRRVWHALNAAIENGEMLRRTFPDIAATVEHPSLVAALGRDALDDLLQDQVTRGNRVELCDGLHTPAAFEAALAPGFQGDLDLATCSSVVLATFIGRRRGNAVKIVHTIDLVDPLTCLIAITAALRRMAAYGGPYSRARLDVEAQLIEIKKELRLEHRP